MPPDPHLIASQALAKALALEQRINALASGTPVPTSLIYSPGNTVVTQSTPGTYTWTCPAGVTSIKAECWGAGAGGGGGGTSEGGEGGGGGEYACEPNYPVVPGNVYSYTVGQGGYGGTTGYGGNAGTASSFDNQNVIANGGVQGGSYIGGAGGSGSGNTIEFAGGSGGGTGSQGTGGCGGGGSAGSAGTGYNGSTSSSSTGVGGGAGGSGTSGGGGGGGNSAANGSNGLAPGGGGGGAGAGSGFTQGQNQYRMSSSGTYYGSDATGGNANGFRGYGTMYQGGETASNGTYNGTMCSMAIIGGSPSSDLSSATIDQVTVRFNCLHSWYSTMALLIGYHSDTSLPGIWSGNGTTQLGTYWISNGQTLTFDVSSTGLGAALKSGAAKAITLGYFGQPEYSLYNYGYMYGAGGSNSYNPLVTVNYHTGSAPEQAGTGASGRVQITYSTSGVLTASLQPAAGTDSSSNAFASGYTGPVVAFQPGSNPSIVEVPHSLSPYLVTATWTIRSGGYLAQYYMLPNGRLQIDFELTASGLAGGNYAITTALPVGYRPAHAQDMALTINTTTAWTASPTTSISTAGVMTAWNVPASTTVIQFSGSFPMN